MAEREQQAEGQIYFIADTRPYTVNEIAETIAKEEGKQVPIPHMPFWVANILSIGLSFPSKLFGFTSPLTRNTVKELKNKWFVDIKKAQSQLGYQPIVQLKDGVKKTVDWFMTDFLAIYNN